GRKAKLIAESGTMAETPVLNYARNRERVVPGIGGNSRGDENPGGVVRGHVARWFQSQRAGQGKRPGLGRQPEEYAGSEAGTGPAGKALSPVAHQPYTFRAAQIS